MPNRVYLDGTTTNGLSLPDDDSYDVTTLDGMVYVGLDDYGDTSDNQTFIARMAAGQTTFAFRTKDHSDRAVQLLWYETDNTQHIDDSTVGVDVGFVGWLRYALNPATPALTFYTSTDPPATDPTTVSWSQLGDVITPSGGSGRVLKTSTSLVTIGYWGTTDWAKGGFYRVVLMDAIGGTPVIDVDLTDLTPAELEALALTEDSSNAATVTLIGDDWAYVRPYGPGILGSAELLLMAGDGNKGFSPKWADRSGNNHHAQLGSTTGADTNDPLFEPFDRVPYVKLPGTDVNDMSTPDVNMMDANSAHGEQDTHTNVQVTQIASTVRSMATVSDAFFGTRVSRFQFTNGDVSDADASEMIASQVGGGWTLVAATEYTISIQVRFSADFPDGVGIKLDDSGSFVSSTSRSNVEVTSTGQQGNWQEASATLTIDAGDLVGGWTIKVDDIDGKTLTGDEWIDIDAISMRIGADGTFVPSTRIIGSLDMRVRLLPLDGDWTPATQQYIIHNRATAASGDGYIMRLDAGGNIVVVYLDTVAGSRAGSWGTPPLTDGRIYDLKITFDQTAGEWKYYIDGVLDETDGGFSSLDGKPSGKQLIVGSRGDATGPWAGDIYWAEVRDGIDGPIVSRFDTAELSEPYTTYTDSVRGNVWTVNRSATGLVSTVIDQDQFLFSVDNYIKVPNITTLDFAASESLTLMILFRQSIDGAIGVLAGKKTTLGNDAGYIQYLTTGRGPTSMISDGAVAPFDQTAAIDLLTLATATIVRNVSDDDIESFRNGVGSGSPTTDTTTLTLAIALDFLIGARNSISPANLYEGSIMAVVLWREPLTDAEVLAARTLLAAEDYRGGLLLSSVGA